MDITSIITLVTKGGGKYCTKYLKVRVNVIKENRECGELETRNMPTKLMFADVLIKLLQGNYFGRLSAE